MTEPEPTYSDFYDANGQPVRRGVQLSPEDQQLFDLYFPPANRTITATEETHQ